MYMETDLARYGINQGRLHFTVKKKEKKKVKACRRSSPYHNKYWTSYTAEHTYTLFIIYLYLHDTRPGELRYSSPRYVGFDSMFSPSYLSYFGRLA
jgi:hypothetical protein